MGQAGEVSGAGWSAWRPVDGWRVPSTVVLAEILDGGQAFRWHRVGAEQWLGGWGDRCVQLRREGDGTMSWSAPAALAATTEHPLRAYLGLDRDFERLSDQLPWRSDAHLARCLEAFPGLRLLRQPFGETLLAFLCSATKQIVQIKQMLALLAARQGAPLEGAADVAPPAGIADPAATGKWHRLPTWEEIAAVPEAQLRACQLGFRARYIRETAEFLVRRPGWLETTATLPYVEARERLCGLPGVGVKVADCVLLFGAGRLEAFPVDVWILKTLARRYGLEGWRLPQLAQFGRAHFGPLAGLAQQYLFAWERAQRVRERAEPTRPPAADLSRASAGSTPPRSPPGRR